MICKSSKTIQMSNGVVMPSMGLGTYPVHGEAMCRMIVDGWDSGYRMIDTSDNYYNEKDLGIALSRLYAARNAKRDDIFLVTKISDELYPVGQPGAGGNRGIFFWRSSSLMHSPTAVHDIISKKIEYSLRFLNTEYIDLLLVHRPYPDYIHEIWAEFESFYKQGVVKAIGVSNFHVRNIEALNTCDVLPMVNQIEVSPLNTRKNLIEYCRNKGIKVMVFAPIMTLRTVRDSAYHDILQGLSKKYGKTPAQAILRWNVQQGLIPIPKSTNRSRLEENISVFDFVLEDADMALIDSLNENRQYIVESKACPGF